MTLAISSKEIETYRENGYLLRERLFTEDEMSNLRLSCDVVESQVKEGINTERARDYHLDQNVLLDDGNIDSNGSDNLQFQQFHIN